MKILIGYDGSECADAAISDLRRAGLPEIAEAQVLTVAEVWLPPPVPSEIAEGSIKGLDSIIAPMYAKARRAVQAAERVADRGRARVSGLFPEWTVTGSASCGSPAWELVFTADRWQPDLIVVGSQGMSAIGRFVLGSVSQVVLNESQSSVRIARGRVEEPDTVRIIVGVDGSAESETAVREVAGRAWPTNSKVKLVVVDDPISVSFVGDDFPPVVDDDDEAAHAWAEKILAHNVALLSGRPGIEVMTELIEGNPKTALVAAAEEWSADCIFVASSGSSNTSARFILGSVSAAVASRALCSVEVVRKKAVRSDS